MIGDVIRVVSKEEAEIVITGRTKHFLSLCGEHLSVDNMNKAIEFASEKLSIQVKEFTVLGVPEGNLFGHHWYVGTDDIIDPKMLKKTIDSQLMILNDDYAIERKHALTKIGLTILPSAILKGDRAANWRDFLQEKTQV